MIAGRAHRQRTVCTRSGVVAIALALTLMVATSCSTMMSSVGMKLVGTTWQVTAMTGFPPENVVGGTITFALDRVGMSNGNHFGCEVKWDDTGFLPTAPGNSTTAGVDVNRPYLDIFLELDEYVRVELNEDGTITLTRGEMVVVAERM